MQEIYKTTDREKAKAFCAAHNCRMFVAFGRGVEKSYIIYDPSCHLPVVVGAEIDNKAAEVLFDEAVNLPEADRD